MVTAIHKLPTVINKYQKSRSALYRDIALGLFMKPVSLGARAVGWPSDEVDSVISARIAGKSEKEIKVLVKSLEAARQERSQGGGYL
ncbi:MAG: AlpA family phage regulatory protein [Gammaproteobacteria bacterium]